MCSLSLLPPRSQSAGWRGARRAVPRCSTGEAVFKAFEEQSGISARAVYDTEETKSTGVVNRLIAEAGNPQADVFWSGDPVRPFFLTKRGIVEPYVSPNAADVPGQFKAPDGT